ncbi:hypothetical protein BAY60_05050 [Prauserella muralis]|uniref:protein-glutamate methylesterase n=2 Tax=Prauserella muralis TaxID=588067 RepID=A0A2V4BFA2_9PSEU|nr:hypothetical protein BAY60_05050 [Prauserella muralis]TWE13894.1 two-component system chemotaxis response regulator CheB [Prauserella muralis]
MPDPPVPHRDLVVMGASAGGVEALRDLVGAFPRDLPMAVLVVLHLPSGGTSALATILDRAGPLPARPAEHDVPLKPGMVTVAPPDHHLLVGGSRTLLAIGPAENGHRPAINALFRSAALDAGTRAVGVILSGTLDDGVGGLAAIADRGGVTVVQDPDEALYRGMPDNALARVDVDHVLPAAGIGALLGEVATRKVSDVAVNQPDPALLLENEIARGFDRLSEQDQSRLGGPSGYLCPDCGGSLAEVAEERFRCRVGHAWTGQALLQAQGTNLQHALATAVRTLEEKAHLARKLARDLPARGTLAERHARRAAEADEAADALRAHLLAVYTEVTVED